MHNLTERERKIVDILCEAGQIGVTEISERLNVSKVTIRSDFTGLVEKGVIVKTRGGAIPAMHPDILERQRDMTDVKRAIAKEAASMVEDGDSIMIVAGTTTAMIGNYLLGKRDIRIVTNSTLLLTYARMNPSIHLTIVGGEFRPQAEAMVGPETIRQLDEFYVKKAFIGTEGFSLEAGLTTQLIESSETIRKMVQRTEQTVLVADSGKYNRIGFVKILPLESMDLIITDRGLEKAVCDNLKDKGLNLRLV
ncbi:MAG: DeoR/GlpR transcriptional regulator [Spirochaetales bacterium]|nr:DeoR/GlpR transcriptional regulator [Spirochaetales bacterium]